MAEAEQTEMQEGAETKETEIQEGEEMEEMMENMVMKGKCIPCHMSMPTCINCNKKYIAVFFAITRRSDW